MNPVETKVIAAIAGGGLGGAIGQFLLWLLGVFVWHASDAADKATEATAAVPGPVSVLLVALVAAGGAGLAGYAAPHTPRVAPSDGGPGIMSVSPTSGDVQSVIQTPVVTSGPSTTAGTATSVVIESLPH
jgi:hypothetical protein